MTTMTDSGRVVIAGVDTHRDQHTAAVIDARQARVLDTAVFPAGWAGYGRLTDWAASFGRLEAVGVEGTGSYGKGLARYLAGRDVRVVEVTRPNRQHRRRHGKSDATDALAAARAVLSGEATAVPRSSDGHLEAMRVIRVARTSAISHQTRLVNQMKALIVTAPHQLRERLEQLSVARLVDTCRRFRPGNDIGDPVAATKTALKVLAGQYQLLAEHAAQLRSQLAELAARTAPAALLAQQGVGPITACDLMITFGDNPHRVRTEAAFAALCGVSAVDASSGLQQRHRLNRGGDRAANAALHRIVMVRLRYDQPTKHYLQRRLAAGKTRKEAMRCLKRLIARDIFYILKAGQQATCNP